MLRTSKGTLLVFLLSLVLHIGFFNINAAEWGDSYRILRAGEYVRNLSYPEDEKRPPLFSVLLAIRPSFVDQVTWGRLEMLGVSIGIFYVFYRYLMVLFQKDWYKTNFGLLLLTLNPVYFYWSIRIMADVVFSMFVLVLFLLLKGKPTYKNFMLMGVVTGLAILTRFEGYLLFGAGVCGVFFLAGIEQLKIANLLNLLKQTWKNILFYLSTTLLTLLPWIIYRNPFTSSYFDEPKSRAYDLNTLLIYLISLLFLFGFTSFFPTLVFQKKEVWKFLKANIAFSVFLVLELLLILAWPAAIPRLFVAVVPLFIVIYVSVSDKVFGMSISSAKKFVLADLILLAVYFFGQYIYRLQSLVLIKPLFLTVFITNALSILALYLSYFEKSTFERLLQRLNFKSSGNKWVSVYFSTTLISMFIWLVATVWIHKDLYRTVKDASIYLMENAEGNVAHNDVGSVVEWYLDHKQEDRIQAFYYDVHDKKLTYDSLLSNKVDYILATNEHNLGFSISIDKRPYLTQVYETSANINGALFNTKVYKFERH